MPLTSRSTRAKAAGKAGFTLLEMMIVLAVMALLVALTVPNLTRLMTWSVKQTTLFDFQRQITGLRSRAYHDNRTVLVVSSGEEIDVSSGDFIAYFAEDDQEQWTYQLSEPLSISPGGVCAEVDVQLIRDGEPLLVARSNTECRFAEVPS